MPATALDDRRRQILRTLIQLHIETGEPVGSESLSRALNRSLSPATLRHLMADLEALGYLHHPHTSAGRVPTDEGYRFFVDSLMARPHRLSRADAATIAAALSDPDAPPERVLEQASHVLSRLSHNVGFVLAPDIALTSFRHIDLVPLADRRILVVMVTAPGLVTEKAIELEERIGPEELQACANYLNTHFSGMTLVRIRERLIALMNEEKALYDSLLKKVVALGERAFAVSDAEASVYLDGRSNILSQREFEDLERMRALFRTFEEKSRLISILNACLAGSGVRVLIGRENPAPELHDLSFVTACYGAEGDRGWGLGVLGSTRMEYGRVVALVDQVARTLADALHEVRT
jgi:heat-inducible transcriptional repressor